MLQVVPRLPRPPLMVVLYGFANVVAELADRERPGLVGQVERILYSQVSVEALRR